MHITHLNRHLLSVFFLLGFLAGSCSPKNSTGQENLRSHALENLEKSTAYMETLATEGGYLWRYSLDLGTVTGENIASHTQVWVQDGTPKMGMTFLKIYEVTKNQRYLDNARGVAMALVNGQLESGGWDYLIEFDPEKRKKYRYRVDNHDSQDQSNRSTYDDNNTQSALSFLMAFLDIEKDEKVREAVDYGLEKIIEAQYPVGAWPQRWDGQPYDKSKYPVKKASIPKNYPREQPDGPYYGHYTFNDNTHRDLVMVLIQAWKQTKNEKYLEAAKKGADYLLYAQLPEPQPVWSQQYNSEMEPAWARAFEPPSATAGESSGIIRMLVDIYLDLGEEKYLEPIPKAIAWFERSTIRPNTWARMYELGTNKPIYGDRDKKIHYTLEEISEERRKGYSWEGSYGVPDAIRYYNRVKKAGRDKWLSAEQEKARKKLDPGQKKALEEEVRHIIQSLDTQNRWISKGSVKNISIDSDIDEWVPIDLYVKNVNTLCDYIASTEE